MNKSQIADLVNRNHETLYQWLDNHDPNKWEQGPKGKWTTGQHVRHLQQSIAPFNKALKLPKFFMSYKFGTSNRETRSYDELVAKYQQKASELQGVVSPFSKDMKVPSLSEKSSVIKGLQHEQQILLKKLAAWKEPNLDKYILPHPLLGRMPLREMFMFMGYHAEHHYKILAEKY